MLMAWGCDDNSTGSDAGFPFITVDAYYRTGTYEGVTVYVVVYNEGDERFHCSLVGDIYVDLPEITMVYPDTTVYTPTYPPEAIDIEGAAITYPDTTVEIEMDFEYLHIEGHYYSTLYNSFDDNVVRYGYYEYTQYGQIQHAYAFERTRELSTIDVIVTLENQHGDSHTYNLYDINGR